MGLRGPKVGDYGAGRTKIIALRLSPEEHAAAKRHAKRAGLSLGAWIRLLMERAGRSEDALGILRR